jgi:exonuclease VII large subunit
MLAPETHQGVAVPVTARLSRRFYEQLGDEVANEMIDWFNQVDATYRTDLRELNELNFARFDAKMEQRFAEADARLEKRFAEYDTRLERRFAEHDTRLEKRFAEYETRWEQRFVQLEARVDGKLSELREFLERRLGEQTRAYYGAWAVQVVATVAVLVRVYLG